MMREKSQLTTLCYIEQDEKYLMLHRVKKEKDVNKDKWIGIGGHFEEGGKPGGMSSAGGGGGNRAYPYLLAFPRSGHLSGGGMAHRIYVSVYCGRL